MFDVNNLYEKVLKGKEAMERYGAVPAVVYLPPRAVNALVLDAVTLPSPGEEPMLFGMKVMSKYMGEHVEYHIKSESGLNIMGVSGAWGGW